MTELGIVLRPHLPIQASIELAQEAERRGFHSIWTTESMDGKDAFTQMAAHAMKTQSIRVGSGIVPIYLRTPILTGMSALALAELSGERAILGLGASHPFIVEDGHGVKLDRPLAHMREYAEIIRLMFEKRQFDYHGEIFVIPRYDGEGRSQFEPRPFNIPIFIAALRTRMACLAGEVADGVLMNLVTPDYFRRAVEVVREGARSAGRDPAKVTLATMVASSISQDAEAAARAVRRAAANYVTLMPFYNKMLRDAGLVQEMDAIQPEVDRLDVEAAAAKLSYDSVRSLGTFGTPQQARQGLRAYEETEADLLVLIPYTPEGSDAVRSVADTIEAFAPRQ